MAVAGVRQSSGTYDEFVHVTAGVAYWKLNDYRLNPENGNWPQRLAALPLIGDSTRIPELDVDAFKESSMWRMSDLFFFGKNRNADALLRKPRMMMAAAGALLAAVVFMWSHHLFGRVGATVSLLLYVFSPTMLAHGALATSDLLGAAFFAAATWSLWRVLHHTTPWAVCAAVFTVSGVLLSKSSGPLIGVIAVILATARVIAGTSHQSWRTTTPIYDRRKIIGCTLLSCVAICIGVTAVIWTSYSFRYSAFAPGYQAGAHFLDPWSETVNANSVAGRLTDWGRTHHVLPEAYLYGLSSVLAYTGRSSFFNGDVGVNGHRWFFPYVALVKATYAELALLLAAPFLLASQHRVRNDADQHVQLYELIPIVTLLLVYGSAALSTKLNIGHRHLLPLMPPLFVVMGAGGIALEKSFRVFNKAVRAPLA